MTTSCSGHELDGNIVPYKDALPKCDLHLGGSVWLFSAIHHLTMGNIRSKFNEIGLILINEVMLWT